MVENLYDVRDPLRAANCDQYDFKVMAAVAGVSGEET